MHSCPEPPYTIPLERVPQQLSAPAKRIVLQLPDGLKPFSRCLAEKLASLTGAEVIIHTDSTFGACDLHYPNIKTFLDADAIVHVGHTPYPREIANPLLEPQDRPRIIYIPAYSRYKPSPETLREAASILSRYGAERVAVVGTGQHTHILQEIAESLAREGLNAHVPRGEPPYFQPGQVIGCDYRLARSSNADAYLIVAGGIFHTLGLYLSTLRPTVQVDPYRDEAVDFTPRGERVYKTRLFKVSQAFGARRWGILVGLRTGQYRPWLVEMLKARIQRTGGEYVLLAGADQSEQTLRSIDDSWYEAFVVTSCPRIPVDDLAGYEKPVLTPGEAFMALERRLEPYRFPW